MRFGKFAAVMGAVALVACGGGDKPADSEATPMADQAAVGGMAAPITGTTHVVQMVGDATSYRYEPAAITIKAGDGIRFDMISGAPHNIAFDPSLLSDEAKAAIGANMPDQDLGPFSGKLLLNAGETWTLSFANVPVGAYEIYCTPHLAMGMKMTVTVQ